jgi:hypothetical protein
LGLDSSLELQDSNWTELVLTGELKWMVWQMAAFPYKGIWAHRVSRASCQYF